MGGEWRITTLGAVITLQRGHDLPEPERKAGSVPVIGSAGPNGWHDKALASGPGVTIGRSGASAGVVTFVAQNYWPHNTCLYVTDFHGNDPRFCYYWLTTLDLARLNSGSAQPSLNRNYLYGVAARIPSPAEQRAIANLLGSLDDKIAKNRRLAETLEGIARTLFKSWFVNFDPVRDKAEGRSTSLPDDLTAQFPKKFGKEGLPEGWTREPLDTLIQNVIVRTLPSPSTTAKPYVPIDAILANSLCAVESRPGSEAQSSLVSFENDDILFGAMRPYFHKVCLAPYAGTTRTTVFVLRPRTSDDLGFSLLLMSEDSTIEFATNTAAGSTIPYAVWEGSLANLRVVIPPRPLRSAYGLRVMPMLRRAQLAWGQSQTIAALRDALLPKLISGELRVADAEKRIAAA